MERKPFQPAVVNPQAEHLHDQYGIPEARINQLGDHVARVWAEMEVREEIELAWAFDELARHADTPEEFTFCVLTLTLALAPQLRQAALI